MRNSVTEWTIGCTHRQLIFFALQGFVIDHLLLSSRALLFNLEGSVGLNFFLCISRRWIRSAIILLVSRRLQKSSTTSRYSNSPLRGCQARRKSMAPYSRCCRLVFCCSRLYSVLVEWFHNCFCLWKWQEICQRLFCKVQPSVLDFLHFCESSNWSLG